MSAVVETVSNVVESVGDVVGQAADVVSDVVSEAGNFIEETGQAVGKTVEAIAQDPIKALPMIAVAVLAPELAPLLEISTPVAGMVLNTGMQLAQGADPTQIATNLATSAITYGVTDAMDLSTGNRMIDNAIGKTASQVIQGRDVEQALGSTIGGSLIGMGVKGLSGDIRDVTGLSEQAPAPITDYSEAYTGVPDDSISQSTIFQDAVSQGFSPEEAYAIAQGQQDFVGPPYAPTAEVPMEPTSDVGQVETGLTTTEGGLPTEEFSATESPFSGTIGTEQTEDGNVLYRFDDGSTLTVTPDQEIVDFTEATEDEYYDPYADITEEETTTEEGPEQKGGIPIAFSRIGKAATQARGLRRTGTRTGTGVSPTAGGLSGTDSGSLIDIPGVSIGTGLTPGVTTPMQDYSLFGEVQPPQQMASGGSAEFVPIDLGSTSAVSSKDIKVLKPGLTKGNINYALPGYPFGQLWRLAAEGGSMKTDHKPEFYSEGGLNSFKNRYVKGKGDGTSDSIPAMLANGEFVIPADVVSSLGNGDNDSGAKVLDEFLRTIRQHKRKADPKKLPPDSKGALGYLLEAKRKVKK